MDKSYPRLLLMLILATFGESINADTKNRDFCGICQCNNRTAICNDYAVVKRLPEIINNSITNLVFSNATLPLILPWYRMSGLSFLKTINLTSAKLSCQCENSWLAFLPDLQNSSVDLSLVPNDMISYYQSGQCEQSYCNNFTTSAIFKLPKNIVLPRDPFKLCRGLKTKRLEPRDYFVEKCGLKLINMQANIVPALQLKDTLNASCTIISGGNPNANIKQCVSLQFLSLLTESFQMGIDSFRSKQKCPSTNGYFATSVTNQSNGWLFCINVNDYLPQSVTSPVYITTEPKLKLQKKEDYYDNVLIIFIVYGYPRPVINLESLENQKIATNAIERGKLTIKESQTTDGRRFNVLIQFKEVSMNCISGMYLLKACNKVGCADYEFNIGSGIPIGMCESGKHTPPNNNTDGEGDENDQDKGTVAENPFDPLHNHDSWVYIFVPFIVVFAVVLVGILTTCFFLRMIGWSRNKSASGLQNRNRLSLTDWELSPLTTQCRLDPNLAYVDWLESIKTKIKVFPPESLEVTKELGEGAFGRVYLTQYNEKDSNGSKNATDNYADLNDNNQQFYAMKVLKFVTTEKLEDLEREVQIMSSLNHANVVRFFGISFKAGTLALLFECMENGDLVNYLRNNSAENPKCQSVLKCNDLLNMATQVARGLQYLAEQHLVHRDLAARNCLVSKNLTIKISDFGMTRDIYITDYYKMGTHTLVPLRWLPPESIIYRKFTSESDVWSFGVLLWEIFTYGKIPWYMHSNCEVLQIIQDGKLLCRPTDCPTEVYLLMVSCWSKIPSDRVTASKALLKLEEILENRLKYCNLLESGSEHSLEKMLTK